MTKHKLYKADFEARVRGMREVPQGIADWMIFYNRRRAHAAHGEETPVRVYRERLSASKPGLRSALQPTALVAQRA